MLLASDNEVRLCAIVLLIGIAMLVAGPMWGIACARSGSRDDQRHGKWGWIAFLVSFFVIYQSAWMEGFRFSDGNRVGFVTKLSKRGYFFSNWEGELQLGGISPDGGGAVSAATWSFSVARDEVAEEIRKAMENGKRVQLHYNEFRARGWRWGSTDYNVVEVK